MKKKAATAAYNMKSKQVFLIATVFLGIFSQIWGADILRPRLTTTKSWPLGNDTQGGVSVPSGKYLNLPAAGPLPLNPYTGNATRIVTDLSVPTVGEVPLVWRRYNNTRVTPGSQDMGSEGNWRHGYQWDFSYTPANIFVERSVWTEPVLHISGADNGLGTITVVYPDGTVNKFAETGVFTGVFVCASSEVTDYIKIDGSANVTKLGNFYNDYTAFNIITSENSEYRFGTPVQGAFRLNSITDSKDQVTTLSYGTASNGQVVLNRITEPGGRYLDVRFSSFSFTTLASGPLSPPKTITQFYVTKVITSDNRALTYSYGARSYGSIGSKAYSLSKTNYPDDAAASYTYSFQNSTSSGAGLLTARDVKSSGIPNIKYTYWTAQNGVSPPPAGSVKAVAELDSGVKLCEIGLVSSENDTNEPVATFIDGSGFGYSIKSGSKGLLGKVRNINDATSQVTYDLTGGTRKTTSKNATNHSLATTRSSLGKILSRTWPKVGAQTNTPTETWTYNNDGYLLTYTDTLSHLITIKRNAKNLARKITYPDGTAESFTYGAFNQIASHTMRNGKTENFIYFSGSAKNGLLQASTDAGGGRTTYTYNANNLVETVTDPMNRVTKITYDKNGAIKKITYPPAASGGVSYSKSFTYDSRGNLLTRTNELGKIWTNTYDAYNRLLTATTPLNRTTSYRYDPNTPNNRNPIEVTLPSLKKIAYTYTVGWGYKIKTITAAAGTAQAVVTTYNYDDNGNVTSVTDPLTNVTQMGYDERERLSYAIDPANTRSEFEYDDANNLRVQRTPDGVTTNVFDSMNRLIQSTEPGNRVTKMTYNALDLIETHTDPQNHIYGYSYDNVGRVKTLQYPDGTKEQSSYNLAGDLTSFTTRANKAQNVTYDGRGRQTKEEWNDGVTPAVTSGYDAANRLTSLGNSNSDVTYGYNDADELITETQAIAGLASAKQISYSNNVDGQPSSMTYPDGTAIQYGYNQRGLLDSIKQGSVTLASYAYNDSGMRTGKTLANGVGTTMTYDSVQRLTSIQDVAPVPTAGSVMQSFSYGYDAMGRRNYVKRNGGTGDVYGYDTEGQLTSVKYGATNPDTTPSNPLRTVSYIYDKAGNRKSLTDKLATEAAAFETTYVTNGNNQYSDVGHAGMSYDKAGNLTGYSETTSGTLRKASCTYDAENRLISAGNNFDSTTLSQAYDPLGRCVKRTENGVTSYLVYDQNWHLLMEYDASGAQKNRYVGGAGVDEMLSRTESSGRVLYYHTDGLGSVTKLTDVNGAVVESYTYDVFGNPSIFDQSGNSKWLSPVGNRFLFTGREYLYSLGVYDYRARIYDPYLGRFWQPDPVGHSGDATNIYRYCGNDPVSNTDPTGLYDIDASFYCNVTYNPYAGINNALYASIFGSTGSSGSNPLTVLNPSIDVVYAGYIPGVGTAYRYSDLPELFEAQREAHHKEEATWRKVAGFVPVIGSGLDAYDAFSEGRWGMGIVHTALAITDLAGAGAIVKGIAKGVGKIAAKEVAEIVVKEAVTSFGCFDEGTPVLTADGRIPIENLRVGDRVLTSISSAAPPEEPVTASWRQISLTLVNQSAPGVSLEVVLLRPSAWLEQQGCHSGALISLDLGEMGVHGLAQVHSVQSCPAIQSGAGRVVTATFSHVHQGVVRLNLLNGGHLTSTAGHPIFSETRQAWIPASELKIGEKLQTHDGTVILKSVLQEGGPRLVFNLEVETDHCFYAGDESLLVHNSCIQEGAHFIYEGVDDSGVVRYIGRSMREEGVRWGEHKASGTAKALLNYRVVPGASSLSLNGARTVEQTLINTYKMERHGGTLLNRINSISSLKWNLFGVY
ncbi:MAG: RHS repeat-associated core domain-containing protein [Luteolibacter sp.]